MESPWRTVQLFISAQAAGIFEVEVDTKTQNTRCSCPVWRKQNTCKHVAFVYNRMVMNDGHYSIVIPDKIPEEEVIEVSDDPKKFRDFIINHAKIEVL